MFYRYNEDRLEFICLSSKKLFLIFAISFFTLIFIGTLIGRQTTKEVIIQEFTEAEQSIVINEVDTFSRERLVEMLKDLNVKYPHIIMAQSIIETGHWSSDIFIENHNLFGMKQARRRITTAEGTSRNHAYYNHWRESVYDYAFYQCRYLSKIDSEEGYYTYLGSSYAEAPNYVNIIKGVVKKEKLKELFE